MEIKSFLVHALKACKGSRGINPLIVNSALSGGEWSTSRLAALPREGTLIPIGYVAAWFPGMFQRREKFLGLPGFELWTVQLVISRFTVSAIPDSF
jgi:hypothetical protein